MQLEDLPLDSIINITKWTVDRLEAHENPELRSIELLPKCLSLLLPAEKIMWEGGSDSDDTQMVSGAKYKKLIIEHVCSFKWTEASVRIAQILREVPLVPDEVKILAKKLLRYLQIVSITHLHVVVN